jgi:hypothetical protein
MLCALSPPFFPSVTLSVPEGSPQNTLVGNPLTATISSPDYTVLFAITGGVNASAFYVDSCSGQVKVRQNVLDFIVQPQFLLNVTASVADFPMVTTTTTIVVNLIEVDYAPVVVPTTFVIGENPAGGLLVGSVPYTDRNRDNVTFSIETDGANGRFILLPNGNIIVSTNQSLGSINFEQGGTWPFQLVVRVTETSALRVPLGCCGLYSTGRVQISLTDRDDPPVVTAGLQLFTTEIVVNTGAGGATGVSVSASDEDNTANGTFASPLVFSLLSPTQAAAVPACFANTKLYAFVPTTDGTSTGPPIFSVNPSTGALVAANAPPSLTSNAPFGFAGQLVRAVYPFCVSECESLYPAVCGSGPALVGVVANLPAVPVATAVTSPAGGAFPSAGGLLTVTGTGFGNPGQIATTAWAISAAGPARRLNLTACAVVSSTSVTCTMPAGSGALFNLYVAQALSGGSVYTTAAMAVQLQVSFIAPTVTAVTGNTGVKTSTGGNLTITGANFSPLGVADAVSVLLGTGSPYSSPLSCAVQAGQSSSSKIVCLLPPYFGAGWGWTLSVGGQTISSLSTQAVSYEVPAITAVALTTGSTSIACPGVSCVVTNSSLAQLSTTGGQVLKISGSGFAITDAMIAVTGTYGLWPFPCASTSSPALVWAPQAPSTARPWPASAPPSRS